MKKFKTGIHIFRRDLRLEDNTALQAAFRECGKVLPVFIFDERQLENNPYRGENAFQFMLESLEGLDKEIIRQGGRLHVEKGIPEEILPKLIKKAGATGVYFNRDYTPFAKERDDKLSKLAGVEAHHCPDALLCEPEAVLKGDGSPYTVFTPYYNKAVEMTVQKPSNHEKGKWLVLDKGIKLPVCKKNPGIFMKGGRKEALGILESIGRLGNYSGERDIPSIQGTSGLSAHLKFGTVSVREAYWAICGKLSARHPLLREMRWRDFFTYVAFHFPHVFSGSFRKQYDKIIWHNGRGRFEAWCEGKTGFPIVDAGMRQLNKTGYMHNRARMIAASFLVKDLHIGWREGERYFASKLSDYDPSVNNGNWQWCASTGCDAQPYFRIFNPWMQQKRFDPLCEYIKKWVPELAGLAPAEIHSLEKKKGVSGYPAQIVEHKEAVRETLEIFRMARSLNVKKQGKWGVKRLAWIRNPAGH